MHFYRLLEERKMKKSHKKSRNWHKKQQGNKYREECRKKHLEKKEHENDNK